MSESSSSLHPTPSEEDVERLGQALASLVRHHDYHGTPLNPVALLGPGPVVSVKQELDLTADVAVGLVVLELLKALPVERTSGVSTSSPAWASRQIGDDHVVLPGAVLAHFLPGELLDDEVVLGFIAAKAGYFPEPAEITVHVGAEGIERAGACIAGLLARAEQHDPLRGKVIEMGTTSAGALPRVVARYDETLDDVVVAEEVRAELERNVLRHLEHADVFQRSGLGAHRGVLLYGPPGTGKTSLVRAIVNAAGENVTVLVPSAELVSQSLTSVYSAAVRLSPSIVVLEDIDVATRDRGAGASASLMGFLNALDGVLVDRSAAVVTIATSNDPEGMDAAAKRPGRIDRFIHVDNPDESARHSILQKNLNRLRDSGVNVTTSEGCVSSIVSAAKGRSGAVLKEIVRRALLLGPAETPSIGDVELRAAAEEVGVVPTHGDYRTGTYL